MWKGCDRPAEFFFDEDIEVCAKHAERALLIDDFESGFVLGLVGGVFSNLPRRNQ